jgi:hypothetical protein
MDMIENAEFWPCHKNWSGCLMRVAVVKDNSQIDFCTNTPLHGGLKALACIAVKNFLN